MRFSTSTALALGGVLALVACASHPPDGGDYEIADSLPARTADPADASYADAGAEENDAAHEAAPTPPTLTTFGGTMAASARVAFGGPPEFCNYDITLKNIVVALTISSADEVTAITVSDTATERALPGCQYLPAPPASQVFTLSKAVPLAASGTYFELAGAAANRPKTTLFVDLVHNGLGYDATLSWKRVDQPAKLNWAVFAKISLLRK